MFAVFDFFEAGPLVNERKFYMKPINRVLEIPFYDIETDCIVLEIQETNGAHQSLPEPFTKFSLPKLDGTFHFLSHSDCEPKHNDKVEVILDPTTEQSRKDIEFIRGESNNFLKYHKKDVSSCKFEEGAHNTLANYQRFLFHTCLGRGGSGSPGVMFQPNGDVVVVTMLLHGYPDWYYSEGCSDIKDQWSKTYCVEQGANMCVVYKKIKEKSPELCRNIFRE